ncbi:MAG: CBS domain-containing protein [Steroidobacteraceae bacterium]|nr:CBS domain-containing protein [Steroidobacteraceae bacterium]MDW8259006.1 CBS domain-containing protein [Gammaproteobacteria bacterium]
MLTAQQLLARKGASARVVYAVEPDDPVLEAIQMMAEHSIGAVLVMHGEELKGILSERDYARKVVLLGRSSSDTPCWQIMSTPVITVAPKDSLDDCMRLMTDKRIRHLPVVEHGRVIGVLSIGDCVKAVIEEQKRTIEELEAYIHH